jgi:hypothetical protein
MGMQAGRKCHPAEACLKLTWSVLAVFRHASDGLTDPGRGPLRRADIPQGQQCSKVLPRALPGSRGWRGGTVTLQEGVGGGWHQQHQQQVIKASHSGR